MPCKNQLWLVVSFLNCCWIVNKREQIILFHHIYGYSILGSKFPLFYFNVNGINLPNILVLHLCAISVLTISILISIQVLCYTCKLQFLTNLTRTRRFSLLIVLSLFYECNMKDLIKKIESHLFYFHKFSLLGIEILR